MPDQPSSPEPSPEMHAADSLPAAMLLAFTGGGLDAFAYLNHGKVFAGAMTGNSVLLGIAVLHRSGHEILHCLFPLLAFIAGVWGAKLLEDRLQDHAVLVGLACEILTLFAASWMPGSFPDLIFVPVLSLAAAYQVASFRSADQYSYNSTFITGNMRSAIISFHDAGKNGSPPDSWRKFMELSLIILGFLAGAISGSVAAPRLLNHTLWLLDLPLLAVLVLVLRRRRRDPTRQKKGGTALHRARLPSEVRIEN